MKELCIGVMGCSSFAQRSMLPALQEATGVKLIAVASREAAKAEVLAKEIGCEAVEGYEALLKRDDIDAVYMPLPTGLHEEWCSQALRAGKHLLVEKSFAADLASAERMISLASEKNCLVFENFQFQTHSQWQRIKSYMSDKLGDVHLVRSTFGFPPLPKDNFRWNKDLGGGALLDAGAYMAKVSQLLLGTNLDVLSASLLLDEESGVDKYGEATFRNAAGQVAQVAFGFDYFYQCRVELLGTNGKLSTNRVFTAPPGFEPVFLLEQQGLAEEHLQPADNHYVNMWSWFAGEVAKGAYADHWEVLLDQARLLEQMRIKSGY